MQHFDANLFENFQRGLMDALNLFRRCKLNRRKRQTRLRRFRRFGTPLGTPSGAAAFRKGPMPAAFPAHARLYGILDLGPEKLSLLVSAIYDKAGKYMGPMVTWVSGYSSFTASARMCAVSWRSRS